MERMQPPPNYYGMPYPNQMEQNPQVPYQNMNPSKVPPPKEDSNLYIRQDDQNPNDGYFTKTLTDKIGRNVSVYCSFTDAADWHDKVFTGKLVSSGDDFIIVDEFSIKKEVLILSVYIHFIEFND